MTFVQATVLYANVCYKSFWLPFSCLCELAIRQFIAVLSYHLFVVHFPTLYTGVTALNFTKVALARVLFPSKAPG